MCKFSFTSSCLIPSCSDNSWTALAETAQSPHRLGSKKGSELEFHLSFDMPACLLFPRWALILHLHPNQKLLIFPTFPLNIMTVVKSSVNSMPYPYHLTTHTIVESTYSHEHLFIPVLCTTCPVQRENPWRSTSRNPLQKVLFT